MIVSYKFRMYPNKSQVLSLESTLEICRNLFNRILVEINTQKDTGNKINKIFTQNLIPIWKKNNPELKTVYSKVLQMTNNTLWDSIKGLSKSKKNGNKVGRLRFRGKGRYKTLNFNQSGFLIDANADRIKISKIGNIRTIIHREIDGKVKGIIVKKTVTGKWFANVQVEKDFDPLPATNQEVGMDVGISMFVTDSDKTEVEYPANIDKSIDELKRVQKELSRKKQGSKNYSKTKHELNLLYETLTNQRTDFLHKLSSYYIQNYDYIAREDLNIKGMLEQKRSRTLNRHILDASWYTFFTMLETKAERAGRIVEKINPKNTSQKCSICKQIVPKKLHDRKHICSCGHEVPRDYNSAQNVLFDAYSVRNRGMGYPSSPVEKNPLLQTISVSDVIRGKIFQ